jgi:uncharacterized protein involved in exopolysaccharide biosynthesis
MDVATGTWRAGQLPAEDGLGLGQIIGAFRRRAWSFAGVVAGILAVAAVILALITPRYAAEVLIMIEEQPTVLPTSLETAFVGLAGDPESVQTEVHVLASRALSARVVRALGLASDPEFMAVDESLSLGQADATVIDAFGDRVSVTPLKDSRVISVQFSSEDPEKAAVVKLRVFAGLKIPEIASILNCSDKTVERHWNFSLAWLSRRFKSGQEK